MPAERTAFQRALLLAGSFGPLGHLPASGTITVAAVGIPLFWLTREWSSAAYVIAVTAFTAGAIWLHDIGDRILGEKDSRRLVWDEIVGFMIAVAFVPFTWQTVLIAFFVERAIDIIKVPPARWIERSWPGGWGVVGDDVIAGLYTCAVLQVLCKTMPASMGLGG
ncbi:MAG: phosphatidylglycerophosphatase A [Planctomycetes bacterium]|nr:phosphatidylglycerophosphatase A [Planctomycetota bacterium]